MRLDELELAPGAKVVVNHHCRTADEMSAVLGHYQDMEATVGRLEYRQHLGARWYRAGEADVEVYVFLPEEAEEASE